VNGVLQALSDLLTLTEGVLWTSVLVFVRTGAMVALLPGLGETALPQRVKLAVVLALTLIVTPVLADEIQRSGPSPALAPIAGEALAGLILGIGLRLFLLTLQTAASIIAQSTTLSQLFAGASPEPQPAIGHLLLMAGATLALAAGLHVQAVKLLILSYDILAPGGYPVAVEAADWGLGLVRATFSLAFSLAAPFVIASMIYNLAMGIINRAMPQLMVSMIGAPALTLGGLALLAVAAPILLLVWLEAFQAFLADPFAVQP
jgi:flagellar biosynthesis protein FliR